MVVAYLDRLMVVSYPKFLSLEINDLCKGKDLAKVVKGEKN